jgi:hypothetical protein
MSEFAKQLGFVPQGTAVQVTLIGAPGTVVTGKLREAAGDLIQLEKYDAPRGRRDGALRLAV